MPSDHVVITGMGVVCSVGRNQQELLASLEAGSLGIQPITRFDTAWLPSRLAGEITAVDPQEVVASRSDELTRCDALAVMAIDEALGQAGADLSGFDPRRVGLVLGTCQGNINAVEAALLPGPDGAEPPFSVDVVGSTFGSVDAVASILGVTGPRIVVSNACAAGGAAIAVAAEKLRHGEIDIAVAGGADELGFFTLAGFGTLQSLDAQPCSPYGRSEGLTVGEGAGIVVLERADDARRRGVAALALLLGYGLSADAYQPTAPDPTGRGAALAMARALARAGLGPEDVDYINGHGTGTAANDQMERKALKAVFGAGATQVPMSSTKSMIGHLLGAAGAVEAIACILATRHGLLPPTIGVPADVPGDIDCVPNAARPAPVAVAMSNSYAFGGSNASLVLGRADLASPRAAARRPPRRVVVSGIGCVGAPGFGLDEWRAAVVEGRSRIQELDAQVFGKEGLLGAPCPRLGPRGMAPPALWRKMDDLARMCVVSARLAWDDAGLERTPRGERENVGVLLATALGSLDLSLGFLAGARRGRGEANPKDFPHSAMNAAAGHVCAVLGLRGPNLSLSGNGLSSIAAISYASDLIRAGVTDRVLVTSADELTPAVTRLSRALGVPPTRTRPRPFDRRGDGGCFGSASVTLVLEALESAEQRDATVHAELAGTALVGAAPGETSLTADTWVDAFELALDRAHLSAGQVGYGAVSAGGLPEHDRGELAALTKLFGPDIRIGAPKSMVGDCLASAGPVNVVAAVLALRFGLLAPTLDLDEPLEGSGVSHVRAATSGVEVDGALASAGVTAAGAGCVLLARPGVLA